MATNLANQLSQIAVRSSDSLNIKAQKAAHSKSLIFEPRIAASQSFDTIYTICYEGFQDLCLLDERFLEFQRNLFSERSQEEDRTQMTEEENSTLDTTLESFLGLVGGRLRLNPAVKAVEWLVRRFRIHEYNTSFVLTTFLPYHTLPIFPTLLSILPASIPEPYRFLHPYIRSLAQPQRRTIVQAASNTTLFASTLNAYVLRICRARHHYPALIAFWAGVMTEAISSMLDKARSGRKGVQQQNEQDTILRILPTLNEGLAMKSVPDLRIGCYMLLSTMASKGGLDDKLLTAIMEAVVLGWSTETVYPGLVCLSVLAQHRGAKQLPGRLARELLKVQNLLGLLVQMSKERRVDKLANGLCLALVHRVGKKGDATGLLTITQIIEKQLLSDAQTAVVFKALLLVAYQVDSGASAQVDLRSDLASTLVALTQLPGDIGSVVRDALKDTDVDIDELEMKLHATLRNDHMSELPASDVEMVETDPEKTIKPSLSTLLEPLAEKLANSSSLLSHSSTLVYTDLCRAFLVATTNAADLNAFDEAPLLRRNTALEDSLYFSFYIRVWCGPSPVIARTSALQMATRCLTTWQGSKSDIQAAIPYALAALGDPAIRVRRAAAEFILAMDKFYPVTNDSKKGASKPQVWAFDDIYGVGNETPNTQWLATDVLLRLLRDLIIPDLEECVLDERHIEAVFRDSMNGSRSSDNSKTSEKARLSQTVRLSVMSFLASHAICTPLYLVKLRLLASLNQIRSIASTSRTKLLLPVLEQWALLNPLEAQKRCKYENIELDVFNDQAVLTVSANDKDGLQFFTKIINGDVATDRIDLLRAVFKRLRTMWPSLKGEAQLHTAQMLLESSQTSPGEANYLELASEESAELLRTSVLSTDILLSFITQLPTAAKLVDSPPATKRRRTSHGEVAKKPIQDSKQLSAAIRKVTFVLQLIDSSNPGSHPELLRGLFNALAELQHFKAQVASELAYLQGLVLGSLLAILKSCKLNPGLKFDRSSVRADLLVDCVQKTASPQVQNAALLLIASLADATPELVLHSVMPIFTFMGNSVLRQSDDYSAHVINQTISEVIPPLILSLRKEKGDPVSGAAELLSSFVAAYEHVPTHRRNGLFVSLVQTLGADDFLFALLAMLIDKYGPTDNIKTFSSELANSFGVETQLQSALKYLALVGDILKPKPTLSIVLLSANNEAVQDPQKSAVNELLLLPHILSQKRLVARAGKILSRDDMDAARVRDLYSSLLEDILALADISKHHKRLHAVCGDVLESLLSLLSTNEFVKSVDGLLSRPNESLRRKILRSLDVRIDQESPSDSASRTAMLGFLPQLTAIIRESQDILYKHTAISCVDKISEKYGKKDLETVAAAAETVAGIHCLGHSDARLRVMALLCLSSLVEILREGMVSVLPVAIPKTLEYMEASMKNDTETRKLHNAAYTFISSLIHHLPYMVSSTYLDKLLSISNISAEAGLDDEADDSRIQCLQLAARQIDAKTLFAALEKNWNEATAAGTLALHENLEILSLALDKHPRSIVTKYAPVLSKIFHKAFDLRRNLDARADNRFSNDSMHEIETEVNQVAIKMIYKFNDSTFRPMFTNIVEWASSSLPSKDTRGRVLRLQSIYGFTIVFFDNLKSIVTSYATYLLENAVSVLKTVDLKDEQSKELWSRVLRTLVKCFENDQDDFWQSPSHFNAISTILTEQFVHASSLPLVQDLVPAVVELAATADSTDHHKELNSAILKHLRSQNASIRLAAVRCEQALADRLGEEWLSMLPEMLPYISELQEDDDEVVERETHRWIVKIEGVLGESLDSMLQ